jgi:thiol peroxidase
MRRFVIPAALAISLLGATAGEQEASMKERKGVVAMKGNPLTLVGNELKVGEKAPDVELVGNDLKPVKLSAFRGKTLVLCSVPSLDTRVCDIETRKFNEKAGALGEGVAVVTVSMDLPFAQARWCGAAGIKNVTTLSDHRDAAFGTAYGALIKELRLEARAVFVVDREGVIRYIEIEKDLTEEPNYDAVLEEVKKLGK